MLNILNQENIIGLAFLIGCTNDRYDYLVAIEEFFKFSNKVIDLHGNIEEAKAISDYRRVISLLYSEKEQNETRKCSNYFIKSQINTESKLLLPMTPHCLQTQMVIKMSESVLVALDRKITPKNEDLEALTECLTHLDQFVNAVKVKRSKTSCALKKGA